MSVWEGAGLGAEGRLGGCFGGGLRAGCGCWIVAEVLKKRKCGRTVLRVWGRYGRWGVRVEGRGGSNEGFGLDRERAEKALPVAIRAARCHGCEVDEKRSAAHGGRSVAVHALLIAGLSSFAWCERLVVIGFWR